MKKTIWIVGLVVVVVAVFGAGVAFAQGPTLYAMHGPMMFAAGANPGMQNGGGYLHTYMVSAFAEKLGLKVDDINARLTAGETMYDIALAEGVKAEDFPALMTEVHTQAGSAALKDGVITQEQADWMNAHAIDMHGTGPCPMHDGTGAGYGPGMMNGNGHGMMGGNWQNQQTEP